MSLHNLSFLFHPSSVAVIGASNRPGSLGLVVTQNLLRSRFAGPIFPLNPHEKEIAGLPAFDSLASLTQTPDLAVVCTPPPTVADIIGELGARGTKVAVVMAAGMANAKDGAGRSFQSLMLSSARASRMRILGPNCLGVLSAESQLNASFAQLGIRPGRIALVAQSGALCASVLDWAAANNVGFSHVVSLGDLVDIDFGDMLDYLGSDPKTEAILLYIESIGVGRAREFMSAARAAARNKPVIAVKAGRAPEGQRAAQSHTGALAGNDMTYDAALHRAGILRVQDMGELFDAAETLTRSRVYRGDRLAIVSNGGGPGVLATDALITAGGRLADLSPATLQSLDTVLPPTWSRGNPVDIIGDALGQRYIDTLRAVLADPGVDAVLVLNVPTAMASGEDVARAIIKILRETTLPEFTCWLGQFHAAQARHMLRQAGLPTYATPEAAVGAFMHTVRHHLNRVALTQVPHSEPIAIPEKATEVSQLLHTRLNTGSTMLNEVDSKVILDAYGIPVAETHLAGSVDDAIAMAGRIGYPVAVKVVSPQLSHKSEVGGVALNVDSPKAIRSAIQGMRDRVAQRRPDATITGFAVQQMLRRPGAHELIVGSTVDPIFGPVILFGQGGTAVELIGDRAIALPPLNEPLCDDVISRTRVYELLKGYRDHPPADLRAIGRTLIQVSQMVIDHPEIIELDINPLLADEHGVVALDARMRIARAERDCDRLAIRPYPKELEEVITLHDGRMLLARPIRPEDHRAHEQFLARLAPEDMRSRFLATIRHLDPSQMARLTQIDYDREMAFIALDQHALTEPETLGVVRAVADPDNAVAEFAIVVRSDSQARGLGFALMQKIIRYCRQRKTRELVGQAFMQNQAMLQLARDLGFEEEPDTANHLVRLRLGL